MQRAAQRFKQTGAVRAEKGAAAKGKATGAATGSGSGSAENRRRKRDEGPRPGSDEVAASTPTW